MKSIGIGILVFFVLTAIYNAFGLQDSLAWCKFYFIKENLICLFLTILLVRIESNTFITMLLFCLIAFFIERILFNIFAFSYSDSMIFSIIFMASICIMLFAVRKLKK